MKMYTSVLFLYDRKCNKKKAVLLPMEQSQGGRFNDTE